jgi:putative phosphoribosyl transferase
VAAVGVAPTQTLQRLSQEADEVQAGTTDDFFQSVGESFIDFSPVDDRQVKDLLEAAAETGHQR